MSCCRFMGLLVFRHQVSCLTKTLNCGTEIELAMEDRVDSMPRTQGSWRSDSGALRWSVSGFGSKRPFTVEIDHIEQIKRAISITNEELRAITDIIRRKRIPFPARAITDRLNISME